MATLPGGRMPAVVDRAMVSTGPGGPLGEAATLSLAVADPDADADPVADVLAPALDDGATDSLGDPDAHPARTKATSAVRILAWVMG